eukprot:scaffold4011_cov115-Alexandrium_tamarense.AAC.3
MAPPSICCTLVAAIFLICCSINGVDSLSRPGSSVSSRRRGLVNTSEVPVLRSTCIANRSGGLPRCTDIKAVRTSTKRSRRHSALLSQSSSEAAKNTERKGVMEGKFQLTDEEVDQSMEYLASLIRHRLNTAKTASDASDVNPSEDDNSSNPLDDNNITAYRLAKGRFTDLTTTLRGEYILENLFLPQQQQQQTSIQHPTDIRLIQHAINTLQSLLVYAMQIGVKGSEEMQKKMVRHLFRPGDVDPQLQQVSKKKGLGESVESTSTSAATTTTITSYWTPLWNSNSIRLLKYFRNSSFGIQLLATMIRKRTCQGAFDLLVEMGVWEFHEDTALLRSGFPVMFLEEESLVAREAENNTRDPDATLGLRKDLRHHKIYTIDSASTLDIDDGISVEVLDNNETSEPRHRYWVHIADVDRWAPRGSKLLEVAERRGTSLYLPTATMPMFPPNMSAGIMSLESYEDKCALSLGVEINSDGSIIPTSIVLTPSTINVDYRLTYDQVDEMLDEGVGYTEEWQIGALLSAATKRRAHRVEMGSTEGMVPFPIPKALIDSKFDEEKHNYDISLKIETTHNSGSNMTAGENEEHYDPYASPVSSSQLIVTEMMIMAGEAMGKWQSEQPMHEDVEVDGRIQLPNELKLPFRRQPAPDLQVSKRVVLRLLCVTSSIDLTSISPVLNAGSCCIETIPKKETSQCNAVEGTSNTI